MFSEIAPREADRIESGNEETGGNADEYWQEGSEEGYNEFPD